MLFPYVVKLLQRANPRFIEHTVRRTSLAITVLYSEMAATDLKHRETPRRSCSRAVVERVQQPLETRPPRSPTCQGVFMLH